MSQSLHYQHLNTRNDLRDVVCLINAAYRGHEGERRWTSEANLVEGERIHIQELQHAISQPHFAFYTAHLNTQLVGCIAIHYNDTLAELGTFAIAPALHGLGYGKQLLHFAETEATRQQASVAQVQVITQNIALMSFYKQRGYVDTGMRQDYPINKNVGRPRVQHLNLSILQKTL